MKYSYEMCVNLYRYEKLLETPNGFVLTFPVQVNNLTVVNSVISFSVNLKGLLLYLLPIHLGWSHYISGGCNYGFSHYAYSTCEKQESVAVVVVPIPLVIILRAHFYTGQAPYVRSSPA